MSRLVHGVGINDADYSVTSYIFFKGSNGKRGQQRVWTCPYYATWTGVIERCYSKSWLKKKPSYIGATACEEWKRFSNFRKWMREQDFSGKQLDKDILIVGNKIYSPNTCIFVRSEVNNLFISGPVGNYLRGVINHGNKFRAQCWVGGEQLRANGFNTQMAAHNAWKKMKIESINFVLSNNELCEKLISALNERILILKHSIANNTIINSLQEEYQYAYK